MVELDARGPGPRRDHVDVVDPEAEVVEPEIADSLRLAGALAVERLVEHDERRVRVVVPTQVYASAPQRDLAVGVAELLDAVEGDVETDHVPVERGRALDVADPDRDVRQVARLHERGA